MLPAFIVGLREGVEASLIVGIIAAFLVGAGRQDRLPAMWAGLGIVVAVVIGYLVYRGGARLNLSRFFRITGFVLVIVAAGLLASAAHSAHEAGWLNSLQGQAVDLSWLIERGSVSGALTT